MNHQNILFSPFFDNYGFPLYFNDGRQTSFRYASQRGWTALVVRQNQKCARLHLKANSTRPALLFTNNGNVKLTAHPAIDTSAGRNSLFLRVENFPERLFFLVSHPLYAIQPHPVLVVTGHLSRTLTDTAFVSRLLSLSLFLYYASKCTWSSMHLHHRFIVAGVHIIFKQEKQAKRGRRVMNKGLNGRRRRKEDATVSKF